MTSLWLRALRNGRGWSVLALAFVSVLGIGMALRPTASSSGAVPAPDFTLPAASGARGALSLRSLRGHPILLNFFQTTCEACIVELPTLRQAARRYGGQKVIVLGVATGGDTVETARRFAQARRLAYPIVADEHQDVAWRYNVSGWPTTFFIDAQGVVRGELSGTMAPQDVRNGLAQAGVVGCGSCAAVALPVLLNTTGAVAANKVDADVPMNRAAPRFALPDQDGATITPQSLRGKVVALTFISALCREQCPLVGKTLTEVRRRLGASARRFAIVAISVDPELDTPLTTHAFASESGWQGADWHYLSAPRDVLSRVWASYYVDVPPPSSIFGSNGQIVHQAGVYLIDTRGRWRGYYGVPFLAPRVAGSVLALLNKA